jgi:hypothetical protein
MTFSAFYKLHCVCDEVRLLIYDTMIWSSAGLSMLAPYRLTGKIVCIDAEEYNQFQLFGFISAR